MSRPVDYSSILSKLNHTYYATVDESVITVKTIFTQIHLKINNIK